jgi:hypothetical protein
LVFLDIVQQFASAASARSLISVACVMSVVSLACFA